MYYAIYAAFMHAGDEGKKIDKQDQFKQFGEDSDETQYFVLEIVLLNSSPV